MQIRRATLADLDAIEKLWQEMALFHQNLDSYFMLNDQADVCHRAYMGELLKDDTRRVFVANDGPNLLGYLMAEINSYPPIYEHTQYGHISALSVTASARRRGIGRQLLEAALDWFREQGLKRVECGVAVENSVSQGFWKDAGFRGFIEKHVLEL